MATGCGFAIMRSPCMGPVPHGDRGRHSCNEWPLLLQCLALDINGRKKKLRVNESWST